MRAWENRSDSRVWDEPFYAHYLSQTGKPHPLAERITREGECDAERVIDSLLGCMGSGHRIGYQKQMAHHLLPGIPRSWLVHVRHLFLIRDPAEMIPSLLRVTPDAQLEDTGLPQQSEILDRCLETGESPPIIDARDLLQDPEWTLRRCCERLGVSFETAMLHWPAGTRESDGIWADYWYESVRQSTGFGKPRPRIQGPPKVGRSLYDACMPLYERLYSLRLSRRTDDAATDRPA